MVSGVCLLKAWNQALSWNGHGHEQDMAWVHQRHGTWANQREPNMHITKAQALGKYMVGKGAYLPHLKSKRKKTKGPFQSFAREESFPFSFSIISFFLF